MNRKSMKGCVCVVAVSFLMILSTQVWANLPYTTYSPIFTNQELDALLAPVALYPDPLLAQLLPASTYPSEIVDAHGWLKSGGTHSGIDRQNWDESVKAIAYYPTILKMMADNIDWTADLGDAFLAQPEDVTRSIQRLRRYARNAGNLVSTGQQTVIDNGDYIEIIPAQPPYIYIPQYDPSVVYVRSWIPGNFPFITFGLGWMIGGWLTLDFDWGHHHVIYHGWNRPGWVNHARSHVYIKKVYVNRSRPYLRQAWRHDDLRGNPERYRALHPRGGPGVGRNARLPEIRGNITGPPKPSQRVFGPLGDTHTFSNRGRESRGIVSTPPKKPPQEIKKQPTISVPSVGPKPVLPLPGIGKQPPRPAPDAGKGPPQIRPPRESVQPLKTPSVTFGGYRGNQEAKGQSLRGQESRQSAEKPRPSPAFERKGGVHDRKNDPKGSVREGSDDIRGKMRR